MLNVHLSTAMKPSFNTEQNRYGISFFSAHCDIPVHKIKFCVVEFVINSCLMWLRHLLLPNVVFWTKENEHFIFMAENNAQHITLSAGVSMHHLIGMHVFEGLLMEQHNYERNGTGHTSANQRRNRRASVVSACWCTI
jgi:hypothetical protein